MEINARCKKKAAGNDVYTRKILETGERLEKPQKPGRLPVRDWCQPKKIRGWEAKKAFDSRCSPSPLESPRASVGIAGMSRTSRVPPGLLLTGGNHGEIPAQVGTGHPGWPRPRGKAVPGAGVGGRVPAASPRADAGGSAPRMRLGSCAKKLGWFWEVALKSSLPAPATLKHSPGACWANVMARPGGLVWLDVGTFVMADLWTSASEPRTVRRGSG